MMQEIRELSEKIGKIRRSMELDPEYFNEWDKDFLESVDRQLEYGRPLSDKQ